MRIWTLLFVFSILSLILTTANADEGESEDDDENEWGEDLGSVAAWLMVASFSYVILRQKISRTKLKELGITTKQYGQSLQATLKLHMWVSAIATILAVYHAWLMIADEGWLEDDSLTGYIPLVAMIYLTLSGILLWRRLPDDWVDRVLRKRARQVHVQRWITVLFVIGLLMHVV
jgi:hypothetical protein